MKVGVLPLFHRDTICDARWVEQFARIAEEAGCESIWGVEHVLVAEGYEPRYPYSADGRMPGNDETVMPDPLEWLSFVAACTSRIRLGTSVLVLPQHSAVVLAKRLATLDALSGGRVEAGVGLGWQREEYAAIGVPFEQRVARMEESIRAMRALWQPGAASFDGETVHFHRVHCDPKPKQPGGIPIVIGGSSPAAARRAGRLGDGFYPYVISPPELAERITELRTAAVESNRDPDEIEITVWPGSWRWGAAHDSGLLAEYTALGVSRLVVSAGEAGDTRADGLARFLDGFLSRTSRL